MSNILQEGMRLSLAEAFELGKTLTKGGVALSDAETAFRKRGER